MEVWQRPDHEVIEDSAPMVALACCLQSEVSQVVLNPLEPSVHGKASGGSLQQ